MSQVAEGRPRLLTAANLVRRGNSYTGFRVPLITGAADVVKLPRAYRALYEQHLIPHLVRAGCTRLAAVEWNWIDGSNAVTSNYPAHVVVEMHPFGVSLARELMEVEGLLMVPGDESGKESLRQPGDYSYELLPVPQHDASWFRRIQLITQDLRWKPKRPWPPIGVMVTELVAYPAGPSVNWAGVVLAGSLEQRAQLRQTWMANLGMVGEPEPPYLGPGW